MSEMVIGLRLKADGSGLVGELKNARGQVSRFGNDTQQAGNKADRASRQIDSTERSLSGLKSTALGIGATIAGAFAVRDLVNFADRATLASNKLRDVSDTTEAMEAAQRALLTVANETRTELGSTIDLYATLQRNARQLVDTDEELVDIVRTINQSFALSGATAESANAAIVQLSQGLASGTLRGDEFNSVAEQAPEILNAVAKYLNVTKGELREMAAEGQITAKTLIGALKQASDQIETRFSKSFATVGQSLTTARNNLQDYIGEQDEALGVTETLSGAIKSLGENIQAIADVLVVTSLIVGGRYAGALATAAVAKGQLLRQTLLATPAVTGMSAALGVQATRASASTIATNALAVSVRGLNAAMLFLGGPAGIALAAGGALLYLANRQDDAAVTTRAHGEEVGELVKQFRELNAVQRQGELDKLTTQEADQKARLLALQQQYNAELDKQKQENTQARPATNQFSGINQAVNRSQALGSIQTEIDAVKQGLSETQALKEKLLSADEAMAANEAITADARKAASTRLDTAIEAYENETDVFSRQLQLKQQILAGNLTAEEAAIYDSMWRQEDAMNQQYARLEQMIDEYYDKEITRATGNKELIALLEQEKADKVLEIKRNQQENEKLLREQFEMEMEQSDLSFWEKMQQHIQRTTENFDVMWGNTFDRFTSGIGDAVGSAVVEGQNFSDTMKQIARGALQTVISGLVEVGARRLGLFAIETAISKASANQNKALAAETGASMASSYAPAAGAATLASFGGNAFPAIAAIGAVMSMLALKGIAHNGISNVPASHEGTWMLRKDEMVLNPAQADNFSYMVDYAKGMQQGASGGGRSLVYSPTFNIDATNAVPGMESRIREEVERGQQETLAALREDFASGGEMAQSLSGRSA